MLALGLSWCRHCERWLPVSDVRRGLCRDGRNADYRARYAANPEPIRQRVYARKRGVDPIPAEGLEILSENWGGLCAYCGDNAVGFDHVDPVSRGGATRKTNIVPACISCNSRKKNHDPLPWIRRGIVVLPEQWGRLLDLRAMDMANDDYAELVS